MTAFGRAAPLGAKAPAAGRAGLGLRVAFAAYAVLLCATQTDVLASLWRTWQSDAYGHGLLLVPVALWLAWRERERFLARPAAPRWDGLVVAAGSLAGLLLADLLQIEAVSQTLLFLALGAGARGLLGAAAGPLLFPLLLPLLAVSLWDLALVPLQQVTVVLAVAGMALTPVPVYADQNFLTIPEGRFVVETTCAGLRYLLAGLTLAVLYGHLFLEGWRRKAGFVALTAGWVVVLNGIRVILVILMGHVLGMEHPWVVDHGDAGWIVFAVGLLPLLWVGRRLERPAAPPSPSARAEPPSARPRAAGIAAGALLALVLAAAGLEGGAEARTLPLAPLAGFEGEACDAPPFGAGRWAPHYAEPDLERCAEADGVRRYLAQWARERPGAELVFYANDPLRGLPRGGPVRRSVRQERGFQVREHLVDGPDPQLVWTSYLVAGHSTASDVEAKLRRLQALATGAPGSTVLAVQVPVGSGGIEDARARLRPVLRRLAAAPAPVEAR